MTQFCPALVCVCAVRGGREGERAIQAPISQDNSLLESMFVITAKVRRTLILFFFFFLPRCNSAKRAALQGAAACRLTTGQN